MANIAQFDCSPSGFRRSVKSVVGFPRTCATNFPHLGLRWASTRGLRAESGSFRAYIGTDLALSPALRVCLRVAATLAETLGVLVLLRAGSLRLPRSVVQPITHVTIRVV